MAHDHLNASLLFDLLDDRRPESDLARLLIAHRRADCAECDEIYRQYEVAQKRSLQLDYTAALAAAREKTVALAARLDAEQSGARRDLKRLLKLQPTQRPEELANARTRYRSPVLLDLLIEEARRLLRVSPQRALDLLLTAEAVAARIATEVYGATFCARLAVRAAAHHANALRVQGDLRGAHATWAEIKKKVAGEPVGDTDAEAELASLEASLRLDQRRFDDAEELLATAIANYAETEDREGLAKALIKLGIGSLRRGEAAAAIPILREAAAMVPPDAAPRLYLYARHNLALCHCQTGDFGAAAALVEANRSLYRSFGDLEVKLRWSWLEGRVARGLGERAAAEQLLAETRNGYLGRGQGFPGALVTLDLAELYLAEGRTAEVKRLAAASATVFEAQDVYAEAARALRLFCEAAAAERLTVELIARLRTYFERAQRDRTLHFEP
jgi:hypothetical protein